MCRGDRKRRKLGTAVPYLIHVVHVELCRVAGLLRFPHHRDGNHALPFVCIDVVGMWAQLSFVMSGTLHGLDGKKAEAPNTPCIISDVALSPRFNILSWCR
jgi:hypothetical protein